jgi:hypothetical protein
MESPRFMFQSWWVQRPRWPLGRVVFETTIENLSNCGYMFIYGEEKSEQLSYATEYRRPLIGALNCKNFSIVIYFSLFFVSTSTEFKKIYFACSPRSWRMLLASVLFRACTSKSSLGKQCKSIWELKRRSSDVVFLNWEGMFFPCNVMAFWGSLIWKYYMHFYTFYRELTGFSIM